MSIHPLQKYTLGELAASASKCDHCASNLPLGPKPIFRVHKQAKILIASQAPGKVAHLSGIPFDDKSGERLRNWMGLSFDTFYQADLVSILPMAFCYPGKAKSGDLPPNPECAPKWQSAFLERMPNIQFTLVIGLHSQVWHLGSLRKQTLTETVRCWQEYYKASKCFPLPHPSPRNNIWIKKNPWFEEQVIPSLREKIAELI